MTSNETNFAGPLAASILIVIIRFTFILLIIAMRTLLTEWIFMFAGPTNTAIEVP